MFRLGMILMTICMAASLVLSAAYKMTTSVIAQEKAKEEKEALKEVLPQADEFIEKEEQFFKQDRRIYYEALKGKTIIGYVLKIKAKGYSSAIDMLVGIDTNGVVQGIEVLSQEETPGLGSRIVEVKKDQKRPWFLEQFKGKIAAKLTMLDIQAISGATISSKAVLEAVRCEVDSFLYRRAHKIK